MPHFDGFPLHVQASEAKFESEAYQLLHLAPDVLASSLRYYRLPMQLATPSVEIPKNILGRRLFVFERAEGESNAWKTLSPSHKASLRHREQFPHSRGLELIPTLCFRIVCSNKRPRFAPPSLTLATRFLFHLAAGAAVRVEARLFTYGRRAYTGLLHLTVFF